MFENQGSGNRTRTASQVFSDDKSGAFVGR